MAFDNTETIDRRDDNARQVKHAFSHFLRHLVGDDDVDAGILGIGTDGLDHVRQQPRGNDHGIALLRARHAHAHRLGGGRRAVVHRSVGAVQAGQAADHRLPLEDVAERALRDLALVRRIGRQELAARGDIRDHGRDVMVVRALSDEHLEVGILGREALEKVTNLLFAHCGRQVVLPLVDEIRGDIGIQVVERADADSFEHDADIFLRLRKIAECSHGRITWRFRRRRQRSAGRRVRSRRTFPP